MAAKTVDVSEQPIEIKDPMKALVDFMANFRKDRNTRIDSVETLQMLWRLRLLGRKGIKAADEAADDFERLMWSVGLGKAREEAVEVLKRVTESKYQVFGPEEEKG